MTDSAQLVPNSPRLAPTRIDSVINALFVKYGRHTRQYRFLYDKLCNLALYSLNAKKFGLADAMISTAVDEVDISVLAEMISAPSSHYNNFSHFLFPIYTGLSIATKKAVNIFILSMSPISS